MTDIADIVEYIPNPNIPTDEPTGRVEFYRRKGKGGGKGKFGLRIIALNGEIVGQLEGYATGAGARKGLTALRRALWNPEILHGDAKK